MQVLRREFKLRDSISNENHFFLKNKGIQVRIAQTQNLIIVQMGDGFNPWESSINYNSENFLHDTIVLCKRLMRAMINNRSNK